MFFYLWKNNLLLVGKNTFITSGIVHNQYGFVFIGTHPKMKQTHHSGTNTPQRHVKMQCLCTAFLPPCAPQIDGHIVIIIMKAIVEKGDKWHFVSFERIEVKVCVCVLMLSLNQYLRYFTNNLVKLK